MAAAALMLAADVLFAAAHVFYIRELYAFSMVFLLLVMVCLPVLLAIWRVYLRTAAPPPFCRRTAAAGARLWCFGFLLLCGFHQVIHDLFVSPGLSAFLDEIWFLLLLPLALGFGLWAVGRLCALLFPRQRER